MKIEDLTLKDIKEMCKVHQECVCPMKDICDKYFVFGKLPCEWEDEELKVEVPGYERKTLNWESVLKEVQAITAKEIRVEIQSRN